MRANTLMWRVGYTLKTPYLRPYRMFAARAGRCRSPDFIIIGTQRGGTSSLYDYLCQSPRIAPPLRKEINFFDRGYHKGLTWYLAHFPVRTSEDFLTFEASTNYMFFPEAAQRVAGVLPNAKLIVQLRNPIDRAYSGYLLSVADGNEKGSFKDALSRECIIEGGQIRALRDLRERGIRDYVNFSNVARGLYVNQLKLWMSKIPRERFLVLKSESLFSEPDRVLPEVLNFLGLPSDGLPSFPKRNTMLSYNIHFEPLDDQTRSQLREFYAPYNEELSRFLDLDLHEWV